ncbi:hypothetical protein N0V86_000214 [Didymella sp. IMI 355093]|nr:hypothetical protein N0V86_000214 [Didymella sp. IMI 355093]
MTVFKSCGAAKKLGPIRYDTLPARRSLLPETLLTLYSIGSKIVRFDIPNLTRRFTVHEDIICRTSKAFKAHLQRERKEIATSCSICFDDLNAAAQDITFCEKCGQNFHEDCIDEWTADRTGANGPATCPICRGQWIPRGSSNFERLRVNQELDGQAVQIYLHWLYSGTITIDASVSRANDEFNVVLLQCWEVSDAVDDESFRGAVICTFFNEAEAHFWSKSINFAFVDGKGSDAMREFVMDIFLTLVGNNWFETKSTRWPEAFVRKLADHCMKKALSGEKIKSYVEIEVAHFGPGGQREEEEEVVDLASEDEDDLDDVPLSNPSQAQVSKATDNRLQHKDKTGSQTAASIRSKRSAFPTSVSQMFSGLASVPEDGAEVEVMRKPQRTLSSMLLERLEQDTPHSHSHSAEVRSLKPFQRHRFWAN